jgi:hypothetical protein
MTYMNEDYDVRNTLVQALKPLIEQGESADFTDFFCLVADYSKELDNISSDVEKIILAAKKIPRTAPKKIILWKAKKIYEAFLKLQM